MLTWIVGFGVFLLLVIATKITSASRILRRIEALLERTRSPTCGDTANAQNGLVAVAHEINLFVSKLPARVFHLP